MCDAASIELPGWALAGEKRRAHIARVVAVLMSWADAMHLDASERAAWHDAGLWHDALRDAPEPMLRELAGDAARPAEMLHGPAAAALLERKGETRRDVLEAIRWHTVGCPAWGRTGRALYMADYLEPGRRFSAADRAYLVAHVPHDFDGTFTQVVRQRLEWVIRERHELYAETVALWNSIR
jgi:2-amino-4-hydroxy-6-hydroxymethyldihydropteridine diphosphokinase